MRLARRQPHQRMTAPVRSITANSAPVSTGRAGVRAEAAGYSRAARASAKSSATSASRKSTGRYGRQVIQPAAPPRPSSQAITIAAAPPNSSGVRMSRRWNRM